MKGWIPMQMGYPFYNVSMEKAYQAYYASHRPGIDSLYALSVVFGQMAVLGLRVYGSPHVKALLAPLPYINGSA
jgi:hypothetical protein